MGRSIKYVFNDIMAFLVSCMMWGSVVIVFVVVFIPWEIWKSTSGAFVMGMFCLLR
jgi:hypothetical protein